MKLDMRIAAAILAPIVLFLIFFVGQSTVMPNLAFHGAIYSNPDYHFAINYPKDRLKIFTSKDDITLSGYIPACDPETTIACFVYPPETFPNTNFSSAGVAVGVLPAKTEPTCLARGNGELSTEGEKRINGIAFQAFSYGDAATSHRSNGLNYRTFRNDICYQISTRLNTTVFEVYEPGTIQKFTADKENKILEEMDKIVGSFRFN